MRRWQGAQKWHVMMTGLDWGSVEEGKMGRRRRKGGGGRSCTQECGAFMAEQTWDWYGVGEGGTREG